MKIIFLLLFAFTSIKTLSQFSQAENEMMEIVAKNGSSIPSSIFLDTSTVKDMQIVNNTNWRHIWMDIEDSSKNIMQFYDIRLKFDTKKDALAFHKKYLGLNSEFGNKIKNHGITFEGATKFSVYTGSKEFTKMMEPYGYQIFCILFVVDNYFVKIYLTCKKEFSPSEYQNYVSTAIKKIEMIK